MKRSHRRRSGMSSTVIITVKRSDSALSGSVTVTATDAGAVNLSCEGSWKIPCLERLSGLSIG